MQDTLTGKKRVSTIVALIIAGEAVFFLPFVMARIFRPTLLAVFEISNTELGAWFAVYGIVAIISYTFGGILADRFPARNLMAVSLWLTSLGGVVMTWIPGSFVMRIVYGFWGFTSIFLFWAAMIRATREWGGDGFQGRAFGWLEGGRGGTAALIGTIAFFLFSWYHIETPAGETSQDGLHAFQIVIIVISVFTFLSGMLVWFVIPAKTIYSEKRSSFEALKRILHLIRIPAIWLLAIMIVCAYVGYKITDDFALYAREVLDFSEAGAAGVGTFALWIRALTAIAAGYVADRFGHVRIILWCYAITVISGLLIGIGILDHLTGLVLLYLLLTSTGIYSVRALYFAIFREASVPVGYTGTAVGIVSFVGFTPDIFMGPWMGYLLDKFPGTTGHQYVFILLSAFAFAGFGAALLFKRTSS
jgi:MFS family permease